MDTDEVNCAKLLKKCEILQNITHFAQSCVILCLEVAARRADGALKTMRIMAIYVLYHIKEGMEVRGVTCNRLKYFKTTWRAGKP